MVHTMKLAQVPFDKIRDGKKSIESRLFDEKRQLINVGDEIEFCLNDDPSIKISTKVVALHRFPSFPALINDFPAQLFGWDTAEEAIQEISQFYSQEQQQKYGVIGIQITKK